MFRVTFAWIFVVDLNVKSKNIQNFVDSMTRRITKVIYNAQKNKYKTQNLNLLKFKLKKIYIHMF